MTDITKRLHAARRRMLTKLKQVDSRTKLHDAYMKYEDEIKDLVVNKKTDELGFPQSVLDDLRARKAKYKDEVGKITSQSDAFRVWDTYSDDCVRIIDKFLASSDQDGFDANFVEDDPPPRPAAPKVEDTRLPSRPAIQVIRRDVEVEDEPAEPEPLRLQFDENELEHDADDPPPAPTPSRANYEKRVADAWRGQVKEVA